MTQICVQVTGPIRNFGCLFDFHSQVQLGLQLNVNHANKNRPAVFRKQDT